MSNLTIRAALQWGGQMLAGFSSSLLEAEVLLAFILNYHRPQLFSRSEQLLTDAEWPRYQDVVLRRKRGEPVAYITGRREFWSLPLIVTPATLIPRPETEMLVELTLEKLPPQPACRVADLGTGAGGIALAIASERPHWSMTATDKMPMALEVAALNARQLAIHNVGFFLGEWCSALTGEFEVIVSNPPYIAAQDPHLSLDVVSYEPKEALLAGAKGLADLQAIIQQAAGHLTSGGWLILEHGHEQQAAVQALLRVSGYRAIKSYKDLADLPRVTVAKKP